MKLLIFGGTGLLGRAVRKKLPAAWEAFCPAHAEYDLCGEGAAERALLDYRPDAVLNCAAMTDVDRCERQPELAFSINAGAVRMLAAACEHAKVPFYHVGTDYVFDGSASSPIAETAAPHPINVYGKSKRAGELAALERGGCVMRVQWLYGHGKSAFVDRILRAPEDAPLPVVSDCFGIPTFADDAAQMLLALIAAGARGLFHGACLGCASWLDFAEEILTRTNLRRTLRPVPSEALNRAAKRPKYTVLDTAKLQKRCPLRPWQEALGDFLSQRGFAGRQ